LKNKLSILTVTIAAFLLVAFTVVPHHHHGAMMCMTTEHHEEAHHDDEHHACATHHGAGGETADTDDHCVAEQEYLVFDQQETNCKPLSCTLHHPPFSLLPALFVWVNLSGDAATAPGKHKYRPAVLLVESAGAGQIHGLRAPPIIS
jgi:Ni/Co efflux regulator RcnB